MSVSSTKWQIQSARQNLLSRAKNAENICIRTRVERPWDLFVFAFNPEGVAVWNAPSSADVRFPIFAYLAGRFLGLSIEMEAAF